MWLRCRVNALFLTVYFSFFSTPKNWEIWHFIVDGDFLVHPVCVVLFTCLLFILTDWLMHMHVCVCSGSWLVRRWLMHMHVCVCCGQLIGEKVAHAYACVCVVGSWLVRRWLMHWQLGCIWSRALVRNWMNAKPTRLRKSASDRCSPSPVRPRRYYYYY